VIALRPVPLQIRHVTTVFSVECVNGFGFIIMPPNEL